MEYVVSKTDIPFDVLFNVAIEKDIKKPVMCIPSGDWQVAIDADEYDFDLAVDIAITMEGLEEEGIRTDTDDTYGDDEATYDIVTVNTSPRTFYYVMLREE